MAQQTPYDWIAAFITIGALAIGLISMAVGWVARHWPTADHRPTPAAPAPAGRRVMSRPASMRPKSVRRARTQAASTTALPVIAKPGNAVNAELPGNADNEPLPDEARDIIRMQAKAEAVVALLKSGKLTNKAEAIELIYGCSRSGRPNSTYQQAAALVDRQMDRYPNRTPEQRQARVELGLSAQ